MEALCDLDMAWGDLRYNGSMSLKVHYPDQFLLEVYGPFGETALFVRKDKAAFLLVSGDEKVTDERLFERRFNLSLGDLIEEVTLRPLSFPYQGEATVERKTYRVTYNLGEEENRICWTGEAGGMCIRFLEARFEKEKKGAESNHRTAF
jgi:hypothetical protein